MTFPETKTPTLSLALHSVEELINHSPEVVTYLNQGITEPETGVPLYTPEDSPIELLAEQFPGSYVLVVYDGNDAVGCTFLAVEEKMITGHPEVTPVMSINVGTMWVDPKFRGRGLGKGLIKESFSARTAQRVKEESGTTLPLCIYIDLTLESRTLMQEAHSSARAEALWEPLGVDSVLLHERGSLDLIAEGEGIQVIETTIVPLEHPVIEGLASVQCAETVGKLNRGKSLVDLSGVFRDVPMTFLLEFAGSAVLIIDTLDALGECRDRLDRSGLPSSAMSVDDPLQYRQAYIYRG